MTAVRHPLLQKSAPPVSTPQERDALVREYARLVKYVVGRLGVSVGGAFDHSDAMQVGSMALLNAASTYRNDTGASFESYAITRIRGSILDAVRSIDPVGRAARTHAKGIDGAVTALTNEIGRPPVDVEVAERLGVAVEEYLRMSQAAAVHTTSIDAVDDESEDDPLSMRLVDNRAADPGDEAVRHDLIERLAGAVSELPERIAIVVQLYYVEELTFREIGEVLGVTESRSCQLHGEAVVALRRLTGEGPQPLARTKRPPKVRFYPGGTPGKAPMEGGTR